MATKTGFNIEEKIIAILLVLWASIHASVVYFFEPIFIQNRIARVFLFDVIGIVLFLWVAVRFRDHRDRFRFRGPFVAFFSVILFLLFSAIIKGLLNGNDTDLFVKEAHVFVFALVVMVAIWAIGVQRAIWVQVVVFHGVAIGSALLIVVGYVIFPSGETFGYAMENYSDVLNLSAISSLFAHKVRIVSYLLAFLSAYYFWRFFNADRLAVVTTSSTVLILMFMFSILSNMRSAVIGVVFGIAICSIVLILSRLKVGRLLKMFYLVVIGGVVLFGAWTGFLKDDPRIKSQLIDKADAGVGQTDSSRIDAMLQSIGMTQDNNVMGFGYGMGAGFERHGNYLYRVNPVDSGFYHIYITHGAFFVYALMMVLGYGVYRMFRFSIMANGFKSQQFIVANLAGVTTYTLSYFNDSSWGVIPDSVAASFVMAISFLYSASDIRGA